LLDINSRTLAAYLSIREGYEIFRIQTHGQELAVQSFALWKN
jgi:hypothetical protein